jgi:signal transduction histidine kinase
VLAIALAGFVGLALNQSVHDTTQGALAEDIELQDDADDLRVAILDVRHHHRNLAFYGPTNDRMIDFQTAFDTLLNEIDEIEDTHSVSPNLPQPEELRSATKDYVALFLPALEYYETDRASFDGVSNQALIQLAALERLARQIDRVAEGEADEAVTRIELASSNARLFLLIVIGGLVLIGAALIYAAFRVIREMDHLYESEQIATQQLSAALQARNDFIADASHELRTPLTVLRGNAEAGLAIEDACGHREILEEIVEESATMTRLVEDLLFLARSDASAPPLEVENVSVEPLLKTIAERSEMLVHQRGAKLTTSLAADGTLPADPQRIEQAVLAIVDNAAKFSFAGGNVRLSSKTEDGILVIEVVDEGPGIPDSELPLIFERFYLVDRSRKRRKGGAGLGLSIARTIIEAHGGWIEAESQLGIGTRMHIHLPLVNALVPGKQAVSTAKSGSKYSS